MSDNIVIRTISRILIPFIQLFAFYVIAHGELGPGGGFQGGVIFSASIILYRIVFGMDDASSRMSKKLTDIFNNKRRRRREQLRRSSTNFQTSRLLACRCHVHTIT